MHRTRAVTLILVGSLAFCTSALAQTGLNGITSQIDRAQKNFDIADRNHDGLVSREEAKDGPVPFIRAHFDAIDHDHQGQVSKEDVAAYVRSLWSAPKRSTPNRSTPAAAASTH
jgi:Ca2+-binding EF-hand superfamily protein